MLVTLACLSGSFIIFPVVARFVLISTVIGQVIFEPVSAIW
jgi:hypothetical protein